MTSRQPKGTPVGGQFAEDRKPSGGDLTVLSKVEIADASRAAARIPRFIQDTELTFVRTMGQGIDRAKSFRRVQKQHTQLANLYNKGGHTDAAQAHFAARDAQDAAHSFDATEAQMDDSMNKTYAAIEASTTAAQESAKLVS